MDRSFYRQFVQWLRQGPVVLAIVVAGQGSVPREVGAKMLIGPTETLGTIGGGAGEAKVMTAARAVLASGKKQAVTIDLSGAAQRPVEGICGGWMRVWLERWQPEQIPLVEAMAAAMGSSTYLVVPFGPPRPYLTQQPAAEAAAYVERLQAPPQLLIVGGGHVGYALAHMADWIGFAIAIQDERPEFANGDRFPQATQVSTTAVADLLPQLPPTPELYIALVTRGLPYDLAALEAIWSAQMPYRYLGMIGSQKRVKTVCQTLRQRGYGERQLQTLYAPIGLPIHALTPEEIAVSICAQLIQLRRASEPSPAAQPSP